MVLGVVKVVRPGQPVGGSLLCVTSKNYVDEPAGGYIRARFRIRRRALPFL